MSEETPAPPPRRRRLLPVVLVAVVLLLAAVTTAVVLWPRDETPAAPPEPATIVPLAGHDVCADQITIRAVTDEEMARIAEAVLADHRTRKVYTETKTEAYERFRQIFRDNRDLVDHARPEALPASVTITAAGEVDLRAWAAELRAAFPAATSVEPLILSEIMPSLTARYGTADVKPPCPPGGERN
ncbi:permease-like cell division protein FtsX [Amycolatopsis dongchuanensis]|uniref:FtsX extracellular domain-containing protein n=1 Tax=Amycolatopsis dongchuanensis TaxID=1070866 RepID=A0ABP9PSJ9_9PSEU